MNIVFDFDGTLHETHLIYYPSLLVGVDWIKSQGYLKDFHVEEETCKKYLGITPELAWQEIAPELDPHIRDEGMRIVGHELKRHLIEKTGRLYEGTREVLEELKRDNHLVLLSNANRSYLETAAKTYEIKEYFDEIIPASDYKFIPKYEIVAKKLPHWEKETYIVGDRYTDIEAALKNKLKSIYCDYGYGREEEGKDADYRIDDIRDILKILK